MTRPATQRQGRGRGSDLLLEHCAAFDRLDEARTPAVERLELELGGDLTRLLVTALSGSSSAGGRPLRV
jgi:hypothetical protein